MFTKETLIYLFLGLLIASTGSGSVTLDNSLQLPTDIFTGFFPCVPGSVNMSTQEDAQNCDLFVYAAVQLALDRVEEELKREQRRLHLSSVVTHPRSKGTKDTDINQVLYNLYVEINHEGQEFTKSLSITRAAIGTDDNYAHGVPVTLFAERIGVPIVSYGLADDRLSQHSLFYRTIPSTTYVNSARLSLLHHFQLYRIGILGSSQTEYKYEMENFRDLFNTYVVRPHNVELPYEGTSNYLHLSLSDLRRQDIRSILGFLGPEEMRMVLCEASSEKYRLTTPNHIWILPSYYNPEWWKGGGAGYYSNQQTKNCTDEEMIGIMNSILFLDPVKYPPLEIPLSEFYPALLNKTRELFTQLSPEVKLEPLLQHSRAVSAYDSTLLLAHSLTEGRVDIDLLNSQIVCELCRIYPDQLLNSYVLEFCQTLLQACQNSSIGKEDLDHIGIVFRDNVKYQPYGQVLITQFINGTHCPMVLFWPITESISNGNYTEHFVPISELSNFSGTQELNPYVMFPNTAVCPLNFYRKGRSTPLASNSKDKISFTEIPVWALGFVGIVTGLSELLLVFLIIFSIVWRDNVHVKSTSPRVNIVMLVGAMCFIHHPIVHGVIFSAYRYNIQEPLGTALCQISIWVLHIGCALVHTGLAVKIYRLYRIFCNTQLKANLRHLYDRDLIIAALVLVIPVMIFLLLWTAISEARYKFISVRYENYHLAYCDSENKDIGIVFRSLTTSYIVIVYLMSLFLSLFITKTPQSIKMDLSLTRAAAVIGTVTFVTALLVEGTAAELTQLVWWCYVLDSVFGYTVMMALIILYQVVLVLKDYRKKVKMKRLSVNS